MTTTSITVRIAAFALASCAALLLPVAAQAGSTKLTLINGWKLSSDSVKPAVSASHGIVRLQGAMRTTGTNDKPFVLPAPFRPAATVHVTIDMCNTRNGALIVDTDGSVKVDPEGDFALSACFVSLEGVSFASSSDGFKKLSLKNGWTQFGSGHADAAARNTGGIVHLQGAIRTDGVDPIAFELPETLRPAKVTYVKTNMCSGANGRLEIQPSGLVFVETGSGFANAQCMTSLDGVSFAHDANGFTPLSLINGWSNYSGITANAAAKVVGGLVVFQGAIKSANNTAQAFILPDAMRPKKETLVPVDMCNATNGRLDIKTDGTVTLQAENDFQNAKCFTSLEGAFFHL